VSWRLPVDAVGARDNTVEARDDASEHVDDDVRDDVAVGGAVAHVGDSGAANENAKLSAGEEDGNGGAELIASCPGM
jgi:hypothetical protein